MGQGTILLRAGRAGQRGLFHHLARDDMILIGVLSDTHGLLRPGAIAALQDVEMIIHAGDIGTVEVLNRLREIAPTVAVRGNVDRGPWAEELNVTEIVEIGHTLVYLIHDLHELDLDPHAAGISVIIYGHSHQSSVNKQGRILYLNPGSAGPKRFRLPVTMAYMKVDGSCDVTAEIIPLLR